MLALVGLDLGLVGPFWKNDMKSFKEKFAILIPLLARKQLVAGEGMLFPEAVFSSFDIITFSKKNSEYER